MRRINRAVCLAPAVLMIAWCSVPYVGGAVEGIPPQAELAPLSAGLLRPDVGALAERDPFRLPAAERPAQAVRSAPLASQPRVRPPTPAELMKRLTLNGTYLRGRRRLALINGRAYAEGEVLLPGADGAEPVTVLRVEPARVLLRCGEGERELRYSDGPPAASRSALAKRRPGRLP